MAIPDNITLGTIYEDVAALTERVSALENLYNAIHADSGWIDLPLLNGATAYSTVQKPQYRKIGNHVYVRGVLRNVTAFPTTIATLPVGFRPVQRMIYFMACNGANVTRLEVETNGDVKLVSCAYDSVSETTHYSFGSFEFLVD